MTESKPISSEEKVPYDLAPSPANSANNDTKSPIQSEIDQLVSETSSLVPLLNRALDEYNVSNALNTDGKRVTPMAPITQEDIVNAVKYMNFQELKPNGSIDVSGGKLTYEDFVQVARDVENVSNKDVSFDKMPTIFIIPSPPAKGSKEKFILDNLEIPNYSSHASNLAGYRPGGADYIVINSKLAQNFSANVVKSVFSHEYGHRVESATSEKANIQDNVNALNSATENQSPLFSLISMTKQNELKADKYTALSGHGDGMIKFLGGDLIMDGPTHPLRSERIAAIKAIQANPSEAKDKLEAALAGFKANVLSIEEAGYGNKTPTPAPTISEQQPSLHIY